MESKEFDIAYNNLINDNRFTNLLADSETLELFAMELWNKALEEAAVIADNVTDDCHTDECGHCAGWKTKNLILSLKK